MGAIASSESLELLLKRATEVWSESQRVNLSPTWKGQPEGKYLAESLAARADAEPELVKLLKGENEFVVAYSLHALQLMNSPSLGHLPQELLVRKELLTSLRGSFAVEYTLGEFAREIQGEYNEGSSVFIVEKAISEFRRNGQVTSVRCPDCKSTVEIQWLGPNRSALSIKCHCGRFRGALRGLLT